MLPNDTKKERLKETLLGLHWAATTGNVGLVKFALDNGVPIDSVVNGFVPLQLACISDNNIAAVQYLIDRGADVNIQNWSKKYSVDKTQAVQGATGSTALHVACANGCIKIVDLLIRNHARIDVKDKYGSKPLDVAQAQHETEIISLLTAAAKQQHGNKHTRSKSPSHEDAVQQQPETQQQARRSIEMMTHKRTPSNEKGNRIRRPSLPSIFEGKQIPPTITMTPSYLEVTSPPASHKRRSFSSAATHRPLAEDVVHSCPATPPPRNSIDQVLSNKRSYASSLSVPTSSPRSSGELSRGGVLLGSSPSTSLLYAQEGEYAMTANGKPDWYAYGVVNSYEDENYLLSLERRAYNLGWSHQQQVTDENNAIEDGVQDNKSAVATMKGSSPLQSVLKTMTDIQSSTTTSPNDSADDGDDEEDEVFDEISSSLDDEEQRTTIETKKMSWLSALGKEKRQPFDTIQRKSLDLRRPNFISSTKKKKEEESSDEDVVRQHQQQKRNYSRSSFFSRWTPSWPSSTK